MKHEQNQYVFVYGIQIVHLHKDTSQIHLEFDSLNKSSQIHVQRYIHVHVHYENPAGRVVHIIAFAILHSI